MNARTARLWEAASETSFAPIASTVAAGELRNGTLRAVRSVTLIQQTRLAYSSR
jgi:hypothetical protein